MFVTMEEEMDTSLVEDGAFTIPGATEFCGLSRSKLYDLMESGQLVYSKIGRSRRIPKRALVQLMAYGLRGGAGNMHK